MDNEIELIKNQLLNLEDRVTRLENISVDRSNVVMNKNDLNKQVTLYELIKDKSFKNGYQKIAMIVGYYEKVIKNPIHRDELGSKWFEAKFDKVYKTNLLSDAMGLYVRVSDDGICDLTLTGEKFFDSIINNEEIS